MTGKFQEGDRVVFTGEAVKLLDPETFSLTDVILAPGTTGTVKKTAGPYYVIHFESLPDGTAVPVEEKDLKREGEP